MICCIVGAGPSPAYLTEGSFVIAADGGLDKLAALGVTPDLILGDFDSLGYRPEGDNVLTFPVEKDDTDTVLAIREAVKRGFDTLYLSGGVGGRLDHTVANLQALAFAADLGARAFLVGERETATVLMAGELRLQGRVGQKLSVFSLGDEITGVTLRGTKYKGEDLTLTSRFPLGVSNEFREDSVTVSVKKGPLLLIWEGWPETVL